MRNFAETPPKGWNSWDAYGASVTEEEVRRNTDIMAEKLKSFGWEYVVVDIQWYEPAADSAFYHKFTPLCMDEYSRLIPAVNRFPSAENDNGFQVLGDYIHGKGLKFGIHILRGIPREFGYVWGQYGYSGRSDILRFSAGIVCFLGCRFY